MLGLEAGVYVLIVLAAGLIEAVRRRAPGLMVGFPVAVATMHLCWGAAFLAGLLTGRAGRAGG
jgi:hypothetical protein